MTTINLLKLLDPYYLFEVTPPSDGSYLYLAIIFVLLVLSYFYFLKRAFKKDLYTKINNLLANSNLTIGLVGLFLIFFRYEGIPYLGSRIMLVVLFAVFLFFIALAAFEIFVSVPKQKNKMLKKQAFEKYLPRAKRPR